VGRLGSGMRVGASFTECPTPCKKGGGIVPVGELPAEIMSQTGNIQGECPALCQVLVSASFQKKIISPRQVVFF